jgi:hypothetical protein
LKRFTIGGIAVKASATFYIQPNMCDDFGAVYDDFLLLLFGAVYDDFLLLLFGAVYDDFLLLRLFQIWHCNCKSQID